MSNETLGVVEIKGLVGVIEAADAMTKAANVALIGYEKIGSGLVMVMIRGDVGAVKVSVDTGVTTAVNIGQVTSQHVIPRSYTDVEKVLPKSSQDANKYTPAFVTGIQISGRS